LKGSPLKPIAVLWDVDGTLVDTAKLHFDAWVRISAELGLAFTPKHFSDTFGRRNPEIIRYLFGENLSDAQVQSIGKTKEEYYRTEAQKGVSLLPGVRELLQNLHAQGVPQAIGSSAPRSNLELILDITGARKYFRAIVGMEDTQKGKPDPEVFLNGSNLLGVDPKNCMVLEDAVAGIEAAKAAGMKAVAVTFVGHHSEASLIAAGADLCVSKLENLSVSQILAMLA
jgi:beta-phosphoglucomutase